jgi:anti-sigma factor RsiW
MTLVDDMVASRFKLCRQLGSGERKGKATIVAMNCEEFASAGLGAEHDGELRLAQETAAREHLAICGECAALAESWDAAREELRLLADSTSVSGAPARVEMRLRQEFRTRHRTMKTRRAAVIAAWSLAAAAMLVGAVSWVNWRAHVAAKQDAAVASANPAAVSGNGSTLIATNLVAANLIADNEESEFTALPGAIYAGNDDAAIVRVRMQRSSLSALGFPVNEDRAAEWIQVDLLVGNDGLPQAVRVAE